MECLEMDLGGSVVKRYFLGYNSFRVVYNQNLKSKFKVENFHIFLTALGEGEGGGSTQAVSLTAFSQFFFEPFSNAVDKALKNQ